MYTYLLIGNCVIDIIRDYKISYIIRHLTSYCNCYNIKNLVQQKYLKAFCVSCCIIITCYYI